MKRILAFLFLLAALSASALPAFAASDDAIPGVVAASPIADSLDQFTDLRDVYAISLMAGQALNVSLTGSAGTNFDLHLI